MGGTCFAAAIALGLKLYRVYPLLCVLALGRKRWALLGGGFRWALIRLPRAAGVERRRS